MLARARSVRQKVMIVVLATTVTALLVTALAMLLYETRAYRTTVVGDLTTQADILGRASAAALAFDDPAAARENLALLRARPQILAASITNARGRPFATYVGTDVPDTRVPVANAPPLADGYAIEGSEITVFHPIVENGERIGTVVILARYDLLSRIADYLGILAAVLVASLAAAVLLSAALQRGITEPILALADVAHGVMDRRDFSRRVPKTTRDEVGYLVDAFNAMLDEVSRRAKSLEDSNRSLQREMEERRGAEEALRAADRRKDEFLATLAHELRNPLAPMRNAIAIQKLAGQDGAVATQARDMLERQLDQMVRLVDDLLDVSRITTGKLSLRRDRVALDAVMRAAVDTARPFIDARRHALELDLPSEPLTLAADATRLAQVFSNLLNNAAKFTPPGGRLAVSAARDGDELVVRVRDSGIGIAPEQLPAVFEMFAQVDQSLERSQAGLGVGLTLARRLIELHGGGLTAHSAGLGHGSEFVVRLPLAQASASTRHAAQGERHPGSVAGRRVLVVDDNQDFANSLALILRAMDNDVRVVHDGPAGLAAAREFRPDIAFLDIGLPGLNGYDLARHLREHPATATATLVAITGWGQDKDRQRAFASGFDHHLVKPVETQRVLAILGAAPPASERTTGAMRASAHDAADAADAADDAQREPRTDREPGRRPGG
jgi:signal transduction histidine kinase/FixJ family two-component response regulator